MNNGRLLASSLLCLPSYFPCRFRRAYHLRLFCRMYYFIPYFSYISICLPCIVRCLSFLPQKIMLASLNNLYPNADFSNAVLFIHFTGLLEWLMWSCTRVVRASLLIAAVLQISEYLDRFVVGQSQAKKTLAVGVYQHYRRLNHNIENNVGSIASGASELARNGSNVPRGVLYQEDYRTVRGDIRVNAYSEPPTAPQRPTSPLFRSIPETEPPIRLEKSNILLLGPSGVGKTFVTQTLARILDVPIALCDCTSMTQAGWDIFLITFGVGSICNAQNEWSEFQIMPHVYPSLLRVLCEEISNVAAIRIEQQQKRYSKSNLTWVLSWVFKQTQLCESRKVKFFISKYGLSLKKWK